MPFRVGLNTYDEASLPLLGGGSYGEVYELGNQSAAKLYYDRPGRLQMQKLTQLFDIGRDLATDRQASLTAAIPLRPALDIADNGMIGFSMMQFRGWTGLSPLCYHIASASYRTSYGFQFTDETAVAAAFSLFQTLYALSRKRLTIGDISAANILVNPADGTPGFIDLDSSHFQDWDSDSQGTLGYVDPRLLEGGLNSQGGYHFDSQSDVFALTAACFYLVTGLMPFMLGVTPPMKEEDFLRRRLSSLRVLLEGDRCLREHGRRLSDPGVINHLEGRIQALKIVRGLSGQDGELLYQHFVQVLVEDDRESLIERLPDGDPRNPISDLLANLRTKTVLDELDQKFRQHPQESLGQLPALAARTSPDIAPDPEVLGGFLATRAIDFDAMVAA